MVTGTNIKDAVRNEGAIVQNDISMDRRTVFKVDAEEPEKERKNAEAAWEWRTVYYRQINSEEGKRGIQEKRIWALGSGYSCERARKIKGVFCNPCRKENKVLHSREDPGSDGALYGRRRD